MASIVADRQEKKLILDGIYLFLKDALFALYDLIKMLLFKIIIKYLRAFIAKQ